MDYIEKELTKDLARLLQDWCRANYEKTGRDYVVKCGLYQSNAGEPIGRAVAEVSLSRLDWKIL